jgi:SecD/SecF fusion protein
MPTNISGRIGVTLAVLLLALFALFPSANLSEPNLKPGIDMVGGTSLLYEIKPPPGGYGGNLAEQVMEALKKRVDPDGVRNLIWRPQGNNRLEIQMPLGKKSAEVQTQRAAFAKATEALEETNVRPGEVLYAIQELKGSEREAKLQELARGSEKRSVLFGTMRSTWDQIVQAKAARDAANQARLEVQFDELINKLADTNLSTNQLQSILDLKDTQVREKRLAELKTRFADFPARLAAIDEFARQYVEFSKSRGSIDDAADLKRLLRGSGVLEFHILAYARSATGVPTLAPEVTPEQFQTMVERLRTRGPQVQAGDELRWYPVERPSEFEFPTVEYNEKNYVLAFITSDKSMSHGEGKPRWALENAYPDMMEGLKVGFTFDPQGARLFGELTAANEQRPLAIVLDDKIISAPNINEAILTGRGVISGGRGGFSREEMQYLVRTLNAGALPAQLTEEPISERTVGPQLGEDNLRRGLAACVFGLVVVAIFLIGYYYLSGVVAMIAVLMNMVLILGAMAALEATFTLPGIAGIVLTIGMAVDANVLIFERLREEQVRGLSLRMALRNAYDRAWYAIFDANVTTGITAAFLYLLGSEEVKGFGLTLLLGILSSMFTALYVTKTIFAILIDKFGITKLNSLPLTFPRWDQALRPNIDWMSKAWMFCTFSAIFIVGGLVLFGIKWAQGQMLDIEFASGTAVQFELREKMPIEDLRAIIDKQSKANPRVLPSPSVVSVGEDEKTYEVVTPNESAKDVREAILTALQGKLNIREQARFEMVDNTVTEAMNQVVFPIEPRTTTIAGQVPNDLRQHVGGVAIVLRNLTPRLSEAEIESRLQHQQLQPQIGSGSAKRISRFSVEPSSDGSQVIVMASDPDLTYDSADANKVQQWIDQLAAPAWNLVRDAINKPADLQKVTNFDAQVAGETQRKAVIALTLSILGVMAYIWLRFGNLKYGTATVVALLHDTLFTLAAVGVAHYIANTFVGNALLVEPFRINLNMVAALLTVMGYSMNDTVVVFDRIRENRGKFGHVDRNVINDSINQTLSRTLLTGGTTIVTILMMYIAGGPGIHGFTFALLVGILVGTYSSIAIASPILLFGRASELAAHKPGTVGQRQLQGA